MSAGAPYTPQTAPFADQVRIMSNEISRIPTEAAATDHVAQLRRWAESQDHDAARREAAELTKRLIETTGHGMMLRDGDLSDLDLSGFDLRRANFNRARLHGSDLSGADLSGAALVCTGMERTVLRDTLLVGCYIHALAAQVCDFTGADFSCLLDATGTLFHGCYMSGVDFSHGALAGISFYQCHLDEAGFEGATLQGGVINECLAAGARFGGAHLGETTITKTTLTGADFAGARGEGLVLQRITDGADMCMSAAHLPGLRLRSVRALRFRGAGLAAPGADITGSSLPEADLANAHLEGARFVDVSLSGANLAGAVLAGAGFQRCVADGASLAKATVENLSATESSFEGADFTRINGRCLHLRDCCLRGARLAQAYLYRAMITGDPPRSADLTGADLTGANLVQAYVAGNLSNCQAAGALLVYARLNQCVFDNADLAGSNLYGASLVKTSFKGARLHDIAGPLYADRCPGLAEALAGSGGGRARQLAGYVEELDRLLRGQKTHST